MATLVRPAFPIALCEAIEEGKVKPGDNLVFVGFGAGLSWAACAVKWSVPVDRPESNWWKNYRRQATYQAAAARSMWKRAVRWVYEVWPADPEHIASASIQNNGQSTKSEDTVPK